MGESHLRYLYRAYKRGELPDFPLPGDLGPAEFQSHILTVFQALADRGGELFVFINLHDEPIGLVGVQRQSIYDRTRAFPHAVWFQEGTARQRLECGLRFLLSLKKTSLVVIEAKEPNWRYFEHLCKYGLLRRVGTLRDAYGSGGRTAIYQGVGK